MKESLAPAGFGDLGGEGWGGEGGGQGNTTNNNLKAKLAARNSSDIKKWENHLSFLKSSSYPLLVTNPNPRYTHLNLDSACEGNHTLSSESDLICLNY